MGIEALGRISAESSMAGRSTGDFAALACRGADALAATERGLGQPLGGGRVVDNILTGLPVTRVIHHGQEILAAACRDASEGEAGKRTARVIAGSVTEEITRGLVITGTVLGVGGAIASGGSVVAVGCLGAMGYFFLPGLARTGAEALIERLDRVSRRMGEVLRDRFGSPRPE